MKIARWTLDIGGYDCERKSEDENIDEKPGIDDRTLEINILKSNQFKTSQLVTLNN